MRTSPLCCVATKYTLRTERLRHSPLSSPGRIFSTVTLLPKEPQLCKVLPLGGVCRHACSRLASTARAVYRTLKQLLSWVKTACEKVKLGQRQTSFYRQLSCDVSGAVCLPLHHIAKQNMSLISGC